MASTLQEQFQTAMVAAMKSKDTLRLDTIRMVRSALKNLQIELQRELTDEDVLPVLQKLRKQRQESIDQFKKANRMDLVAKEESELKIIEDFLPQPMSQESLGKLVEEQIQALAATSVKDMGKVIQAVMKIAAGRVDGKDVSAMVKNKLQS